MQTKIINYKSFQTNNLNLCVGYCENKVIYLGDHSSDLKQLFAKKNYVFNEDPHLDLTQILNILNQFFQGQPVDKYVTEFMLIGTPFQQKVWRTLARLSWGKTQTYGELAASIQKPKAVRAVASAVGKNPIFLLIPCHRIIGKQSQLKFRGGSALKLQLLNNEGVFLSK
ncbi:methylated DNA-protein cysteine methyltransferase [Spiroplasma clarkii]|uniref:methylated-DNA--[protein]-cysteine S-methyltransferase n=1 Tax=Spiroplasma clarkii TaxID=2139 RepID=A0A1Y0L1S9_9MOLU|nr:methylated-DNA--[protein]-cysteine S-methyltransferase [Spiroplasma clarkii]ARU91972.1 methylated DNA-protein cysteine methyltransferase [Spiroplasma clarkii]ATX71312.1 methylated-DNA-[protein]-cysteine S-methyltransferase [Spiroplasma clarkii]